jgi:hypothetical protein
MKNLQNPDDVMSSSLQRRSFLKYAGAGAAGVALLAVGCKKSDITREKIGVYVGNGDVGILNYAYALEQLEAAFYTQVVATPYSGMSAVELSFLTDIRDHEIAHREFFKAALKTSAIPALEVDFSSIDFNDRKSVLGTAMAFEDLGVTAYDGVGYLLKSADYLLLAGKIVSVEARHAALIRELIAVNTFLGDQVDMSSVNISRTPIEVLQIASKYLKTELNIDGLHAN